jgi:hypothetical protein
MKLVYEIDIREFELVMIAEEKKEREKRKGLVRRKIEKEFVVGLESQEAR